MKGSSLKRYLTFRFISTVLDGIALLICGFLLAKSYLIYLAAIAVCFLLTIIVPEGQRIHLKLDAKYIPVIKPDRLDWIVRILLWIVVITLFIGFASVIPDNLLASLLLVALITGAEIPYYRYARKLCKEDQSGISSCHAAIHCRAVKQYVSYKMLASILLSIVFLISGIAFGSRPFLCYTVSGICFLIAFILVDFQRRKQNIRRSPAQSVIITVFDVIVCHLFSVLVTLALIPFLYTNIVLMFSVEASLFALFYLLTQIPVYFYAKRMEQGRPNRWSRA